MDQITKENYEIVYAKDGVIPEEYKDFPKNIDPELDVPFHLREKKENFSRWN